MRVLPLAIEDLQEIYNYIVFYIVNNEKLEVNVLRVLYGKMDFTRIWN